MSPDARGGLRVDKRQVAFSLSQEHSAPPRRPYLGKDPRNGAFDLGVLTSCSASHEVGDEPRWGKDCRDHRLRWLSSYLEPEEPRSCLRRGAWEEESFHSPSHRGARSCQMWAAHLSTYSTPQSRGPPQTLGLGLPGANRG